MKTADHINKYRQRFPGKMWDSDDSFGMYGAFSIPLEGHGISVAECIVSAGDTPESVIQGTDWEHVSVKVSHKRNGRYETRVPTWEEMCRIKETFWKDTEAVIQIHPPKSDYVNCHPHVLHLWRPADGKLRLPPKICV